MGETLVLGAEAIQPWADGTDLISERAMTADERLEQGIRLAGFITELAAAGAGRDAMAGDQPAALDPTRVFETLNRHGVDYLVIGGVAVIAHGHVRATKDIDLVASGQRENLERLAAGLRELGARLRVVDAEYLSVDPTNPDDLANGANWTMVTDAGWVDFMAAPPGATPIRRCEPGTSNVACATSTSRASGAGLPARGSSASTISSG